MYKLFFVGMLLMMSMSAFAQSDNGTSISPDNITQLAQIGVLQGAEGRMNRMVFSADGRYLIGGSDDTSLRVWEVATQTQSQELFPHNSYVKGVALHPNGALVASASWDRQVILYDFEDGFLSQRDILTGYNSVIDHIVFSEDGEAMVFGVGDGILISVSSDLSEKIITPLDSLFVTALTILPSDAYNAIALSTGFPDDSLMVLLGDEIKTINKPHTGGITALAFSPIITEILTLATAGDDSTIHLWAIAPETLNATITTSITTPEDVWYTALTYTPLGDLLIATTLEGGILAWDMTGDAPVLVLSTATEVSITTITISPDGTTIATGHDDGTIMLWGIGA